MRTLHGVPKEDVSLVAIPIGDERGNVCWRFFIVMVVMGPYKKNPSS